MASRSNSLVGLLCLLIACELEVKGHEETCTNDAGCGTVNYYFIKSHLNGLVLDVENSNASPGASVFLFDKHGDLNQQWYDDPATGTIRSRLNDFCMDFEDGQLVLNPYQPGKDDQQWERTGAAITNRKVKNLALDILGEDTAPKAKVIKYQAKGGPNQSWIFEMV